MTVKKYKMTDETIEYEGHTLHRIISTSKFRGMEVGTLGGWIESTSNLDSEGTSWVEDGAKVFGNAKVSGYALVSERATVKDNAEIYGSAQVCENALVCGNAKVFGHATIYNDAVVDENAHIYGDAQIYHHAVVNGNAEVYGQARVRGKAHVGGKSRIYEYAAIGGYAYVLGNAKVYGDCIIDEEAIIEEDADVSGFVHINGRATIIGDAVIRTPHDFIVFKNNWGTDRTDSYRWFTYTLSNKKWSVGCFYGTGKELIERAYKESDLKGKSYEATVKYAEQLESIYNEYRDANNEEEEDKVEQEPIEKCPLCGSDAVIQTGFTINGIPRVRVHCKNLECDFSSSKYAVNKENAIKAWNTIVRKLKIADSLLQYTNF